MKVARIPNYVLRFANEGLFAKLPRKFLRENLQKGKFKKSAYFYCLSSRIAPLSKILEGASADDVWKKAEAFCARCKPPCRLPKELDWELAYLAGAMRDGSICRRKNQYTLSLFQSGKHSYWWLRKVSSIFRRKFGISPKIEADRDGHRMLVFSKPVVLFFESAFEMPTDQRFWATPTIIKTLPATGTGILRGYVAGFFDAEGYVTSIKTFRKTGKTKLAFYQNNLDSLEFLRDFLAGSGFKPHLYKDKEKFFLCLYGKEQLRKFYAHFPVLRKKKQLSSLLDSL